MTISRSPVFALLVAISVLGSCPPRAAEKEAADEDVRDRLWIWGHPAGEYNESYLAAHPRKSAIEPVDAARAMGISNMIFVRAGGKPQPPYAAYYEPFRGLKRVYWSLVGAGGITSEDDRKLVRELAEANENIRGFILDDFFHEPVSGDAGDPPWLAENEPRFPVTVTLAAPEPTACDAVELVQTAWPTGDYRSNGIVLEVSEDGDAYVEASRRELPNEPGAGLRVPLTAGKVAALRVRIVSTHDEAAARSCGLGAVRLFRDRRPLSLAGWTASASSTYPGFDASTLVGRPPPFRASMTPDELGTLRRWSIRGERLPVMAVVYTGQISPRAKAHLDAVDEVCMWTWRPRDLERLETNLARLERLVPGKPIWLGCYMFDFDSSTPLPVDAMKAQTELGHRWLREGRIRGMIFLATPNVDVGLEAVEWTREWIASLGR